MDEEEDDEDAEAEEAFGLEFSLLSASDSGGTVGGERGRAIDFSSLSCRARRFNDPKILSSDPLLLLRLVPRLVSV